MTTIRNLIDQRAADHPERTFIVAPETNAAMSYGELLAHMLDISAMLEAMEIQHQDKVAFLLPNGYWTAALFLGVPYSGRVIVPLNAVAGPDQLAYVIEHSDCKAIFVAQELLEKFSAVLRAIPSHITLIMTDVDHGPRWPDGIVPNSHPPRRHCDDITPDETAVLIYTSGTTGRPKGVLLSHGNAVAGGRNTAGAHELTADDRALCVLPLYHINGEMVTIMGPLVSGGSVVLPRRFKVSQFWNNISEHRCSWFSVVPTIIAYLLAHAEREDLVLDWKESLSQLRFGRSASAPLAPEMHRAFERRFQVPIIETMGLSETAAQILSNPMPPGKAKYGSPGIAYGNEARIIDEAGQDCPDGVTGELLIRGPNVMSGYYKDSEATAEALKPDGWLRTGDLACRDADGFYFITGRLKELIIKGGENISPREIDEVLHTHPSVLEAACFAAPDPNYGQEVMACVKLKPDCECAEDELKSLSETKLGSFKAPRRIFFLADLPKGPSGKIQRLKLPELINETN